MVMQISFHRILVFAPDLNRAREFYGDVLGLHLLHGDDRALTFKAPTFMITVFPCVDAISPQNYSQRPGVSVAFSVPSLEAAMADLTTKGVKFLHSGPNAGPIGKYAAFRDPFGTVFELMEAQAE
jgi:catechol 2,3-dioxygenase-like lactoylglutathione lyase family enzyme